MPLEKYIELFDEAKRNGAMDIQFSGADPLLNKNFIRLTKEVVDRGYSPFVSTKQFVSKSLARQIKDAGLREMQVSLDSFDDEIAALLTGCSGYKKMALASIENLLEVGIEVRVKAVGTGVNLEGIPTMVRELARRRVKSVLIDGYGRSVFRHEEYLYATNEDIVRCKEELKAVEAEFPDCTIMTTIEEYFPTNSEERAEAWKNRASCSAGRSQLTIMTDGTIVCCDQVPATSDFFLGSVADSTLAEQWGNEKIERFLNPRKENLEEPCRSCDLFDDCNHRGRCVRDVYVAFGDVKNGDPKCPVINMPDRF